VSARPRIVHVYKDYWPPVLGGIERSINWMVHGCADAFDITVLVNSRDGTTRERTDGPIRIIEVGQWGRLQSAPIAPSFPLWLRRLRADLWHFHIPNPTGDFSYLLARPRGRVVATYHSDVVRQKMALRLYGPFLRAFLRRCDAVMPTSPRLVESSPFLREVREKCRPVPLGMPLAPFAATPERANAAREIRRRHRGMPLLVFVGRLRYYKGLHFLVGAMRALPHVQFLVVGEGPEGPRLRRLAEELGVAERIHFLGELDDEATISHLHAADIFVMPSHLPSEAYGLSQIEAMACGKPVVCCDLATGVPWVTQDGETGIVVPPADEEALAAAIAKLLGDSALRFRMGEAAYRRAHAEFSRERMAERIKAVYAEALGG
jgi:rhamnosyl/mannosyltransferase